MQLPGSGGLPLDVVELTSRSYCEVSMAFLLM